MRKLVTVLSLFFVTLLVSFGQFKRQREYSGFFDTYYFRGPITFTLGGGMTTYRGDLTNGLGLKGLSYGFSVGANYKLWPHTVFGAEFSYVNLKSTDFNQTRDISFGATGYELQAYGRLYFIDEIIRVAPDRRKESQYAFCKPYLHLGVGAMMFQSTAQYNNTSSQYFGQPVSSSGNFAVVLPVGLGLQFTVTQRSSICAEYIYRFTTTDYLDNVTYPGSKNDGYGILQVKFQFAPTAPKKKKKLSLPPPAKYDGAKGTETWKTKKQQEQQNKPRPQEYEIPESNTQDGQGTEEGTQDGTQQEQVTDENQVTPQETTPTEEQNTGQ